MLPGTIASAIAARDLGYAGVAQLIIEQQLGSQAIVRLFTMSASSRRAPGLRRDRAGWGNG